MKILLSLTLLVLLFSCSPRRSANFGDDLFRAIKEQDQELFFILIITEEDVDEYLKTASYTKTQKIEAKDYLINYKIAMWKVYYKQVLTELKAKGTKLGMDWSNARCHGMDIHRKRIEPKAADIYINVSSNGREFKIKADDVLETKQGWALVDDVTISRH